jgi:hypothetical protein
MHVSLRAPWMEDYAAWAFRQSTPMICAKDDGNGATLPVRATRRPEGTTMNPHAAPTTRPATQVAELRACVPEPAHRRECLRGSQKKRRPKPTFNYHCNAQRCQKRRGTPGNPAPRPRNVCRSAQSTAYKWLWRSSPKNAVPQLALSKTRIARDPTPRHDPKNAAGPPNARSFRWLWRFRREQPRFVAMRVHSRFDHLVGRRWGGRGEADTRAPPVMAGGQRANPTEGHEQGLCGQQLAPSNPPPEEEG